MATANYLPEVLESSEPERLATGFIFTEGPLWHPDGFWYFVDLRRNQLLRLTPGKEPELVRTTIGGNGTTFDLQGRLIVCEGDDRRLTRRLDPVRQRADPSRAASTWCSTSTSTNDTRTAWSSPSRKSKIFSAARFRTWRGSAKTGGRSRIAARHAAQIHGHSPTGRRGPISWPEQLSSTARPEPSARSEQWNQPRFMRRR